VQCQLFVQRTPNEALVFLMERELALYRDGSDKSQDDLL